jgi:hypothetical protein
MVSTAVVQVSTTINIHGRRLGVWLRVRCRNGVYRYAASQQL